MRLFDPYLRSDVRSDKDLENLAYFGTQGAVVCAHDPSRFECSDDLLAYFEHLLVAESARLRQVGIQCHHALGVNPRSAPRRAFHELWPELESMLGEPSVVAIGELAIDSADSWEYGLVEHQLRLAARLGLPVILRLPSLKPLAVLKQVVHCAKRSGLATSKLMLTNVVLDAPLRAFVQSNTIVCALRMDSEFLSGASWSRLQRRLTKHDLCLTHALGDGMGDVLSMSRAVLALTEQGLDETSIDWWSHGNALSFFGVEG